MAEEIKNVNAKVDELEAAAKKYASKDTVISIGGYEFTPAKLMVAATIVSSILGGLYGTFEVYKDYVGMKKKIAEYAAPDLSGFDKRLVELIELGVKSGEFHADDVQLTALAIGGIVGWAPVWFRANGRLSLEQVTAYLAGLALTMVRVKSNTNSHVN